MEGRKWEGGTLPFNVQLHVLIIENVVIFMWFLGSREQAFVYALSSAAVLQAVSKTCSSGAASKCGCGLTPLVQAGVRNAGAEGFKWGGCADNVAFGAEFSRSFCDARWMGGRRRRRSKRAATNLHNNHAGRMVSGLCQGI